MAGLSAADGPKIIDLRLAGGRPVLGVCVGMQVMFEGSAEPSESPVDGVGEWPGTVTRLLAPVVPHMGWSTVDVPERSVLFDGIAGERFYFVHSYAAHTWELSTPDGPFAVVEPRVTWATHGERFVAAVENGPLSATQFHPEKSGDAGLALLRNWVRSLILGLRRLAAQRDAVCGRDRPHRSGCSTRDAVPATSSRLRARQYPRPVRSLVRPR